MTTSPPIGIPYFAWITEDAIQDGQTIPAYEGRRCPECGTVVRAKTDKSREYSAHWEKNHK